MVGPGIPVLHELIGDSRIHVSGPDCPDGVLHGGRLVWSVDEVGGVRRTLVPHKDVRVDRVTLEGW